MRSPRDLIWLRRAYAGGADPVDYIEPRFARHPSRWRRARRLVATAVILAVVAPPTAAGVAVGTYLFAPLPATLPTLVPGSDSSATAVLASDGTPMGSFRPSDTRIALAPDAIPDNVRRAVVASEDRRFYTHRGVDWKGTARALRADLRGDGIVQGGSTITQQLVKNATGDKGRNLGRKLREAALARRLERSVPKDEILAAYLNAAFFGEGLYGVEAASRSYFSRPAAELSLSQAALLAGIIPAPSRYAPRQDPAGAELRRLEVLRRLERSGLAAPAEVAIARAEPTTVAPRRPDEMRWPYFAQYVSSWLLEELKLDTSQVYGGGLTVTTTLDPAMQAAAEAAATAALPDAADPQAAVVAVEPATGAVRAMVGGRDFAASQVNLAAGQGGSGRQPGSSFKAFVLAEAYRQGMGADRVYPAPAEVTPAGFNKPVTNYDGRGHGHQSLGKATAASTNTVYAQLIVDVGIHRAAAMARRMGIPLAEDEAIGGLALGAVEVTPLEMASAYASFASGGIRSAPTPVSRVTTPDGRVLYDIAAAPRTRVLDPPVAAAVGATLAGVITEGTARGSDIGRPAAAKTGTTSSYADAWMVGYTPQIATAVWVGHPGGRIPMHGVHGVASVTGGTIPAAIWKSFMVAAHANLPVLELTAPAPAAEDRFGAPTLLAVAPGRRRPPPPPPPPPTTLPPPTTTTTVPPTTTTTAPPTTTTTTTAPPTTTTTVPATTTTTVPATTTTTAAPTMPTPMPTTTTTTTKAP